MQVRQLLQDDEAVSPVIGVILMVAITVILAAVIAAFVLGLGDTNEVSPNPTLEFDYDSGATGTNLEVSHTGGDSFNSDRVSFNGDVSENGQTWTTAHATLSSGTTISAGDSVMLTADNDAFELDVIWTSADGESSSTIAETSGPNA